MRITGLDLNSPGTAYPGILLLILFSFPLSGQQSGNFWRDVSPVELREDADTIPLAKLSNYRGLALDLEGMEQVLRSEDDSPSRLTFPLPDGSYKTFTVSPSRVLPPGLAARYPKILTFQGKAVDDPHLSLRFDISPRGLHASITGIGQKHLIKPIPSRAQNLYAAYDLEDIILTENAGSFQCGVENDGLLQDLSPVGTGIEFRQEGTVDLRVYRLAMACTVEFTKYFGGTRPQALVAIASQVNRLNEILENDLAIRLELVEESDSLIFVDADMYTNGSPDLMYEENPPIINAKIGVSGYDIGHVVGTHNSFGGIAFVGGICNSNNKARGASTMNTPEGDAFIVSVLAHEIGHQLGASHSFNSCHNATDVTAFEPGGGTTIMSYAGICFDPVNNLQNRSDDYFHTASLEQIYFNTQVGGGSGCAQVFPTVNSDPSLFLEQESGFYIPISTPFRLRAQGLDSDNDELTYTWEEFDLGPLNSPPGSPEGNSPLFRSLPPTENPERVFPSLDKILSGTSDRSEVLPTYSRDLTFRCTVRDNFPGSGGIGWDLVAFKSDSTAGPFRLVGMDTIPAISAGSLMDITWDVAGTTNSRINCQYVNILLSLDGGQNFTDTLALQSPNTGSSTVTVPNTLTEQARIMVEASDNIFFAISGGQFTILPPTDPTYIVDVSPRGQGEHCLPQPLTFEITSDALLGYDEALQLDLVGDLPAGSSYTFSEQIIHPARQGSSTLTIQLASSIQDTFSLAVQITDENQQTSLRDLEFSTLSNDFSQLQLLTPVRGARNISFPGPFTWTRQRDADSYEFGLATGPGFQPNEMLENVILVDTSYQPDLHLPDNEIYYWRVTPINQCGLGEPSPIQAFQSGLNTCEVFAAEDLPINIPGAGQVEKPTIKSIISIEEDGTVDDLNMPFIEARYQPVRSLKMTLTSPAGTRITLLEPSCGSTLNFLTGFDDESPDSLRCPPADGLLIRPVDSLAHFKGEDIRGDWTLAVTVELPGFGSPGTLLAWNLEFCAPIIPADPILEQLDTLHVPPGLANTVLPDQLTAFVEDEEPDNLVFTLLSVPTHGQMLLEGDSLATGDTFTQQDIDNFYLTYLDRGNEEALDSFLFMVQDSRGGWLYDQIFPISIYQGAIVDTDDVLEQEVPLTLSPNPARDVVYLDLDVAELNASIDLALFSLQGSLLRTWQHTLPAINLELSLNGLPAGTYILHLKGDGFFATGKIVVQP